LERQGDSQRGSEARQRQGEQEQRVLDAASGEPRTLAADERGGAERGWEGSDAQRDANAAIDQGGGAGGEAPA